MMVGGLSPAPHANVAIVGRETETRDMLSTSAFLCRCLRSTGPPPLQLPLSGGGWPGSADYAGRMLVPGLPLLVPLGRPARH